ncbi:hypothetical protein [Streptomyces nigra]
MRNGVIVTEGQSDDAEFQLALAHLVSEGRAHIDGTRLALSEGDQEKVQKVADGVITSTEFIRILQEDAEQ